MISMAMFVDQRVFPTSWIPWFCCREVQRGEQSQLHLILGEQASLAGKHSCNRKKDTIYIYIYIHVYSTYSVVSSILNNINLDPLRLGHEFERARNFGFSLGCSEFPEASAEKNQAEMIETLRTEGAPWRDVPPPGAVEARISRVGFTINKPIKLVGGDWNMFYFSMTIGNVITPIDFHIVLEGVETTNQKMMNGSM